MSSLTDVAQQTRALIVVGVIMLVLTIVGYYSWGIGTQIVKQINPTPPPQPTLAFGLLPEIVFPKNNAGDYTYQSEIVPRNLVSIQGYFVPVYLITNKKQSSGFFNLDRAKSQAASLDFVLEPKLLEGTLYRWNKTIPIPSTLDMDTANNTFDLTVNWETDPSFLTGGARPSPEQAVSEIKTLLRNADFLPEDLENGTNETTLLKYKSGELVEAISLSETEFIEVNLYRKPITYNQLTYPVLLSDPQKGLVTGLVSSNRSRGKRIVSVDYKYITIDYENPQTYPYITAAQAVSFLNEGVGYVAREPDQRDNTVTIRSVEVAYYDPLDESQKYLQPIYVIRGDNDFVAYVPAIAPQAIAQQN